MSERVEFSSLKSDSFTCKSNNIFQFNVSFSVKKGTNEKFIVSNACDVVKSGETLAIMGPSGAGKTTLLKALTLEAYGGITKGSLTFNGKNLDSRRFRKFCGLVAQEDHHWAFLTCRETISFAADLFLQLSTEEKKSEVERMLNKMGLESCADTIIGNIFMKGLSGGQMRRLSLAVILLKKLHVVILDEPTSGLDAASAAGTMKLISELTKEEGLIMIYTIHQPSTVIYNTFDRIMVLSSARVAYCGHQSDVLNYFESIHYPIPSQTNPAEFMIDLVNSDFNDAAIVANVINQWEELGLTTHINRIDEVMNNYKPKQSLKVHPKFKVSLLSQMQTMFKRHLLLSIRDPTLYIGRFIIFLCTCTFFAIIYISCRERTQEQAQQRMWITVWFVGPCASMAVIAVFSYNIEFQAIKREVRNGMITPISYLFANSILQLPAMILFGIFSLSLAGYGIIDFNGEKYIYMVLLYALIMFSFECIAQLLSVACDNPMLGMLMYIGNWFASFLFCGLFLRIQDIVWPFRIFSYILPFRYAANSLVYEEFIGKPFSGASLCDPKTVSGCYSIDEKDGVNDGWICDPGTTVCYGYEGWQVLSTIHNSYSVITYNANIGIDVLILIAISIFCKIFYVIIMILKANGSSSISKSDDKNNTNTINSIESNKEYTAV